MFLRQPFARSPLLARVVPFVIFLALTFCQGRFGAAPAYWFYFAKTFVGVWLIWEMRAFVTEMRWAVSWEAVGVGLGVFVIWVGLDPFYPHLMKGVVPWNPTAQFGEGSALAWMMIVARIAGSTLVVPHLEEGFYRSFLYRYLAKPDFTAVKLNQFLPLPFIATAVMFGLSHNEWLAGIFCGAADQWLGLPQKPAGGAVETHALTQFLLGAWVV